MTLFFLTLLPAIPSFECRSAIIMLLLTYIIQLSTLYENIDFPDLARRRSKYYCLKNIIQSLYYNTKSSYLNSKSDMLILRLGKYNIKSLFYYKVIAFVILSLHYKAIVANIRLRSLRHYNTNSVL